MTAIARERRHKPKIKKRRRFGPFRKLFSVLLAAAAVAAACLVFFRINEVTVEGSELYSDAEVIAASGIQAGDSLVILPAGRVASHILLQLPYVRSVHVERALPDGVRILITEHTAAAAVQGADGGGWWIIASQGKLLENRGSPDMVMKVLGLHAINPTLGRGMEVAEGEEHLLARLQELLQALEAQDMLAQCTQVRFEDTAMVLSYLTFEAKLPFYGDLNAMLDLLREALATGKIAEGTVGIFDFTVTEGKVYFRRS